MKKFNVLFGAIALAAFTSCSNDELVSQQTEAAIKAKQTIGFNPLATNATRSTVYTPSSMFPSFRVVGLWTGLSTETGIKTDSVFIQGKGMLASTLTTTAGSPYQGFGTDGLEIVNNNGSWDYKDQSKIQYWPFLAKETGGKVTGYSCQKLDFHAVTPASTALDLVGLTDYAYTTPAVANMEDICYAQAENQTNANSPVTLTFKHLLSQVLFKAIKPNNYVVDIKGIEIGGVGTVATFTKTDFSNLDKNSQFTATTPATFQGFTGAVFAVPDDTAKATQVTPSKQELLLIPQTVTKWDKATKASASGQGYLMIEYRAKLASAAEWATADGDGYTKAYFALPISWKAGNKYIYTLCFGGITDPDNPGGDNPPGNDPDDDDPSDENGNPKAPSIPITFTANVDDWTEQVVDTNAY